MIYWVGYYLFRLFSFIFFPRTVIGRENLPKSGNFLVASNHISNLDPFIVGVSCKRRFSYIAKEELFENKFVGFILRNLDAFPIKRQASDLRALRQTILKLNRGKTIVLFPEGTRKRKGQFRKIQAGIAFLAVKTKLPVVPVYLEGSDKVLPPDSNWIKRSPVTVKIGKPIDIDYQKDYPAISKYIMEQVYSLK